MRRWFLTGWIVMTFAAGCGGAKSVPERAAVDFMDHYYVQTNLKLALEDTDGFARQKVSGSLQLTEGQAVDESTRRPAISYRLVESRVDGPEADYLYELQIQPSGLEAIRKKTRLKVREREGGEWKVTQFSDYDHE